MKVFVVSLARAEARIKYITAHLESLNLDYELIDAVDYQQLTPKDFERLTNTEAIQQNQWLTKGVIACSLSHVKVYKHIVENDVGICLVIEDDAVLPQDIKKTLAIIEGEISRGEIISLSYFNHHQAKNSTDLSMQHIKQISNNLQLVYPVDLHDIASAMAYVITKEVAANMLKVSMPIANAADHWGDHRGKGGFDSFRCVYPPQVRAALLRSAIDYAHSKTLMSKIAGWIREYNVPVLSTFLNRRTEKLQTEKYHFSFIDEPPFNEPR